MLLEHFLLIFYMYLVYHAKWVTCLIFPFEFPLNLWLFKTLISQFKWCWRHSQKCWKMPAYFRNSFIWNIKKHSLKIHCNLSRIFICIILFISGQHGWLFKDRKNWRRWGILFYSITVYYSNFSNLDQLSVADQNHLKAFPRSI